MSDEEITSADVGGMYTVGDIVKTIVLDVDTEQHRISLGLKPSYFEEEDMEDIEDDGSEDEEMAEDEEMSEGEGDAMEMDSDEEEQVSAGEEQDPEEEVEQPPRKVVAKSGVRKLVESAAPLEMIESDVEQEESSDEEAVVVVEDEEDGKKKKKSRKVKMIEKQEREAAMAQKENMIASGDAPPETAQDFERLLLGSPSSSFLWIKYMAFQFGLAQISKAREIAERALKTISFREEKEKMNVWVAYLNLEFSYGSKESLKKVFDRACAGNEPKAVYMHLAQIYSRAGSQELATELYAVMVKKFRGSSKVWTSAGLYHLVEGRVEESRDILQKSVKSLPKHKHVKTISKFAQYEFKHGEAERGRTIFEGMLANYAKKVDLWNVYLDMEIKIGQVETIRRLFERVICLKFSSKKIKFFFKKFLEYESGLGSEGEVEKVKEAAVRYVEGLQEE
jgi:rRNA biogenesis protein RRP5